MCKPSDLPESTEEDSPKDDVQQFFSGRSLRKISVWFHRVHCIDYCLSQLRFAMKRNLVLSVITAALVVVLATVFSFSWPQNQAVTAVNQSSDRPVAQSNVIAPEPNFDSYWNQGQAELTSYTLEQARYGELHQGSAVMVFVTEPFSQSKQVKLDDYANAGSDRVPVLKLNATKKFNTGVYPYSMMASSFSPIDLATHPHALKITSSSQEWCGQTFAQVNNRDRNYQVQLNSYFEAEGDENFTVDKTWLEDELWSRIRINPASLPTGDLSVLPSLWYTRLRHRPFEATAATATITDDAADPSLKIYALNYPSQSRSLSIHFAAKFPHEIQSWEETHLSGFGRPQPLTTKATLNQRIMSDYWNRNSNADSALRQELGLS